MTAESNPQLFAETALKREWDSFRVLFTRIGNGILNRIFALNIAGSNLRRNMLFVLFLLAGLLATLPEFGSEWRGYLRNLFTALFTNQAALPDAILQFLLFLYRALTDPATLRLLPVFYLPFVLSLHLASVYLADIFEIEDINIARKFISEVALMGGDNELRLSAAKIDDTVIDKSPITRIGGPGYITVELDTALLVEKPDGRSRVIGPTHDQPYGKAILEGFERIRDMIDLRDQVPDALEINGRSRDGIPIGIGDVRMVFSIFRDKKTPTSTEPHPFTPASIQAIVYNKTYRVTDGAIIHQEWYRSAGEPIWVTPMKMLIMRDLGIFIGRRDLGEYLASIGVPERQAEQQLSLDIAQLANTLSPNGEIPIPAMRPAPNFAARPQLSALFSEFTNRFNEEQKRRGVQVQWVGVGTWKMPPSVPSQAIPEKHLEAWRLTLENLSRRNAAAISNLQQEGELSRLLDLIREIIAVYRQSTDQNLDDASILSRLIFAYRSQLRTVTIENIPVDLREQINRIVNEIDSTIHWVRTDEPDNHEAEEPPTESVDLEPSDTPEESGSDGASVAFMITQKMRQQLYALGFSEEAVDQLTPDRAREIIGESERKPSSPLPSEEELYRDLLTKVLGDREVAERLILLERRSFPRGNRKGWIKRAIERWKKDNW